MAITHHPDLIQGSEEKYGRLALIDRNVGRTHDAHILSAWRCDCGVHVNVAYSRVKNGYTISCGCYGREKSSERATTHGGKGTPEYGSWQAMKRRCERPGDKDYPRYGGRGVSIYSDWSSSFEVFRDAVGPRAPGTTLDRIDPLKGYEPGNVRWAPPEVQGRNRRGTFIWHIKGETFGSITEAAAAFSVSEQTIHRWVRGTLDKRRGRFTEPKADCSVEIRHGESA